MATFLVDVLTAGNRLNAKGSSVVEKVQPFTRPDVLQKKGKSKKKEKNCGRLVSEIITHQYYYLSVHMGEKGLKVQARFQDTPT